MAKKRGSTMDQSQRDKFADKARKLGCDEDEAAFDAKLKTVAGQKPKPEKDEAPQRPKKGRDKEC